VQVGFEGIEAYDGNRKILLGESWWESLVVA
jgi:hypothetical protein